MDYIFLVYDVAAIAIVIFFIIKGKNDGFTKTFVETAGFAFAVISALVIGRISASFLYTALLKPGIIESIESSLGKAIDVEDVINSIEEAVASLPAISKLIFDFGAIEDKLDGGINMTNANIAANVEESVISPVVMPLLEIIIFALVLILFLALITVIARKSKKVNEVPVIGGLNAFFGGIIGALEGAVVLAIVSTGLRFLIKAYGESVWLSENIISKTYIFKWIYFTVCGEGEFDLVARFLK